MLFFISKKLDYAAINGLRILGSIAGISVIIGTLTLSFLASRPQHLPIKYKLTRNNHTFYLESANSPTELEKGLKYRSHLEGDRGMLFNLGKPYKDAAFWMYRVNFPLDIIFIHQGIVTRIVHNATPCRKQPCPLYTAPIATHVLELPSGKAKLTNIKIRDKLTFYKQQESGYGDKI
ncbi:DUF192 domain-containing protein [Nostoc sp. FACHB-280]|uniref:DUF192 domain-containing protein n=1 Tax=Nostoc sp. FACHB-280 TaxID=2692839 RepID=UPI00168A8F5E|nr:DUF192 domain-containing protein [Nostoc sp. FACHB-280]MBD2498331.1 DUF192 domain-containing protein [Nostoc sp. FACHB-280]